jgi:hypothetical protein
MRKLIGSSQPRAAALMSVALAVALLGGAPLAYAANRSLSGSVSVSTQSPNPVAIGSQATYTVSIPYGIDNGSGCTTDAVSVTGLPTGVTQVSFPTFTIPSGNDISSVSATLTLDVTNAASVGGSSFGVSVGKGDCKGSVAAASGVSLSVITPPDTTAPIITLNGDASISLSVGATYTEQGATATDNVEGSVTVVVGGDVVNTSLAGTYEVTYNAEDTAGNDAIEVVRTIIVSNTPDTTAPAVPTHVSCLLRMGR